MGERIRDLRIRYAVPTALGGKVIHGCICRLGTLKQTVDRVRKAGYEIVGYDERFRDEDEQLAPGERWFNTDFNTHKDEDDDKYD